jgi:3-hydroxyacyl-[acyl-carrier-protein] dehydratase
MAEPLQFQWAVAASHPALAGHFPRNPIIPGVVLLDQLLMFALQIPSHAESRWDFQSVKFTQTVRAEELLDFEFSIKNSQTMAFRIIRQDLVLVAQGSLGLRA